MSVLARLRHLRREGSPYVLLLLYVLLTVAAIAWIALVPGEPFLADGEGVVASVTMTAILVAFVLVRSFLAWWIAIFFAALGSVVGTVVSLVAAFEPEVVGGGKAAGLAMLEIAALVLLLSPAIEDWLEADRRRPQPARHAQGR